MDIKIDRQLDDPRIVKFLEEHLEDMKSVSPPESKHALDLKSLRKPDITFWTVDIDQDLVACGALKELTPQHGEIKSMRTAADQRGKGLAATLAQYIINTAKERGYQELSLETGSMPFFEPARLLYEKLGFQQCPPFANYQADPNSVFYSLRLD